MHVMAVQWMLNQQKTLPSGREWRCKLECGHIVWRARPSSCPPRYVYCERCAEILRKGT
jgi:hypothetical protein